MPPQQGRRAVVVLRPRLTGRLPRAAGQPGGPETRRPHRSRAHRLRGLHRRRAGQGHGAARGRVGRPAAQRGRTHRRPRRRPPRPRGGHRRRHHHRTGRRPRRGAAGRKVRLLVPGRYRALFRGRPAPDEPARRRRLDAVDVHGGVATAAMTLRHGADTFTDVFLLIRADAGWRIANKAYHRHT
ncbi:nuclear transport factor 2 family protein [Streptomyces sp. CL7]|uniref:nuclear transport factor 2 family protein n=1 Tax=Streptomyces sp. CL7 TaxID=3096006 RepID=UPI002A7486B7|nr:nuclear transport factor 2 family protein [Streptomyces sp. CL7]WPP34046.1 nuclear transport factor 2 family protein [Streptomyces sp. CL7]